MVHCVRQRVGLVAHYHHTILRLLAGHVLHQHVANNGVETTTAYLFGLVVGVYL